MLPLVRFMPQFMRSEGIGQSFLNEIIPLSNQNTIPDTGIVV